MLIRECNHYINKGYAPLYALDSISEMYDAYHALGGNGVELQTNIASGLVGYIGGRVIRQGGDSDDLQRPK